MKIKRNGKDRSGHVVPFAVPWSALTIKKSRDGFVLNADQSVFERVPGFDKTNWPDFSDPA